MLQAPNPVDFVEWLVQCLHRETLQQIQVSVLSRFTFFFWRMAVLAHFLAVLCRLMDLGETGCAATSQNVLFSPLCLSFSSLQSSSKLSTTLKPCFKRSAITSKMPAPMLFFSNIQFALSATSFFLLTTSALHFSLLGLSKITFSSCYCYCYRFLDKNLLSSKVFNRKLPRLQFRHTLVTTELTLVEQTYPFLQLSEFILCGCSPNWWLCPQMSYSPKSQFLARY